MTAKTKAQLQDSASLTWFQWLGLAASILVFFVPSIAQSVGMPIEGLSISGQRMLSVFLLAIILWVTEAIPLHATAAVIILLEVLLISDKAIVSFPEGYTPKPYGAFFAALSNPILMLFLGGFFIADGATKFDLDRNLARVMLKPFGTSPKLIMLGMMVITAVFSMFMSNTATTATMMMVVLPVIRQLPENDRMRTALALCIPVAANIGGIGTPIGTPPNAIALGALSQTGTTIDFLKWMIMTLPFVTVILLFSWIILLTMFRTEQTSIRFSIDSKFVMSRSAKVFYCTAGGTILLWFTSSLHGISSNVIGFFPVVVLLSTKVFTSKDLQAIQWHVLWLLAGGIALGVGVGATGLDAWMVSLVSWENLSPALIVAVLALAALTMGTFISHSATANLLVPLGITLAMSPAVQVSPVAAVVFIAIGSSLAMALPVSTPPNAIAVSTGMVRTRDMAIVGVAVGIVGMSLFIFVAPWFWRMLGTL